MKRETSDMERAPIIVSAVVLTRPDGSVLTVRKAGTAMFMLPGGKPERHETPRETAIREIAEELRIELDPQQLRLLGKFYTAAANEANTSLVAHVFEYPSFSQRFDVEPQAEISERRWVFPDSVRQSADMAPLNRHHIFPMLVNREIRTGVDDV
jgi:8-oxo-dGTP diphosphatase